MIEPMENTMTAAYTAKKISPMLAVADMEETLAFYHDILGFTAIEGQGFFHVGDCEHRTDFLGGIGCSHRVLHRLNHPQALYGNSGVPVFCIFASANSRMRSSESCSSC